MTRFVIGADRSRSTLFPARTDDYGARIIRVERSMFLSMSLTWQCWALAEP